MNFLDSWINASEQSRREFNQEMLITEVAELICDILDHSSISRAQLAEKLGVSKSYVTQLLTGSRNMTLRTLSSIATVLDKDITVRFGDKHASSSYQKKAEFDRLSDRAEWDASSFMSVGAVRKRSRNRAIFSATNDCANDVYVESEKVAL